ncbi:hypothetical protein HAZT_HAZT001439 [Hyalella azteca]|uniref:Uncharacterized protein n=1 Tax=Hyalella azteca TaxID=294128 RepID=A0A6A0GYH2_HYAAZ|nr:hypothetical protein HAZT_HAZT001439 [Hyalella azteca]
MVTEGKMHGFLRMYWAKKILDSRQELIFFSMFQLCYYCCLWSIGGLHDQGWREREVFGKIRYMNYAGCNKKMNIKAFVSKYRVREDMPGIILQTGRYMSGIILQTYRYMSGIILQSYRYMSGIILQSYMSGTILQMINYMSGIILQTYRYMSGIILQMIT